MESEILTLQALFAFSTANCAICRLRFVFIFLNNFNRIHREYFMYLFLEYNYLLTLIFQPTSTLGAYVSLYTTCRALGPSCTVMWKTRRRTRCLRHVSRNHVGIFGLNFSKICYNNACFIERSFFNSLCSIPLKGRMILMTNCKR